MISSSSVPYYEEKPVTVSRAQHVGITAMALSRRPSPSLRDVVTATGPLLLSLRRRQRRSGSGPKRAPTGHRPHIRPPASRFVSHATLPPPLLPRRHGDTPAAVGTHPTQISVSRSLPPPRPLPKPTEPKPANATEDAETGGGKGQSRPPPPAAADRSVSPMHCPARRRRVPPR